MTPCTPGVHFLQFLKFAGFPVFINETLYLSQKNLTLGPVLPQFLSDGAQILYAYGPLHVDSESFCLEQPVLNVEDAVKKILSMGNFMKSDPGLRRSILKFKIEF